MFDRHTQREMTEIEQVLPPYDDEDDDECHLGKRRRDGGWPEETKSMDEGSFKDVKRQSD